MSGINFQPQVGNTANGPRRTIWIPQHDGLFWRGSQNPTVPAHWPTPYYGYGAGPYINQMPPYGPHYQPYDGYPPYLPQLPMPVMLPNPRNYYQPGNPHPAGYPGHGLYGGAGGMLYGGRRGEHLLNVARRGADDRPQDIAPSDPDINRMYPVQERDGNWTRRNRATITADEFGTGKWFIRHNGTWFFKRNTAA